MAEGGCRAGVPVRPRPRLHDLVVGRRAARRRRRRGDARQHRRPRRASRSCRSTPSAPTPRSSAPSAGSSASPSCTPSPARPSRPRRGSRAPPRALGRRVGRRARRLHPAGRGIRRRSAALARVDNRGMTQLTALTGALRGRADARLDEHRRPARGLPRARPRPVVPGGGLPRRHSGARRRGAARTSTRTPSSVPFSVTKNTIGLSIGLLVERGELDLDALGRRVLAGVRGRRARRTSRCGSCCRIRPECRRRRPPLTAAELLDHHVGSGAARRLDAVLVPRHRLRLSRPHDRQPRVGARLPGHRTHAARVLRAGDPRAARHRLLPRPPRRPGVAERRRPCR